MFSLPRSSWPTSCAGERSAAAANTKPASHKPGPKLPKKLEKKLRKSFNPEAPAFDFTPASLGLHSAGLDERCGFPETSGRGFLEMISSVPPTLSSGTLNTAPPQLLFRAALMPPARSPAADCDTRSKLHAQTAPANFPAAQRT